MKTRLIIICTFIITALLTPAQAKPANGSLSCYIFAVTNNPAAYAACKASWNIAITPDAFDIPGLAEWQR
ncbi:MAG: hypothetical protein V3W37_02995 [Candidatus Binatia bacterium]